MDRHQHPSNNAVLGAPPGVAVEDCMALPITRVYFQQQDEHAVVSFWKPDAAELALIAAGRPVRLCVMGRTHPPLSIGVDGDGVML